MIKNLGSSVEPIRKQKIEIYAECIQSVKTNINVIIQQTNSNYFALTVYREGE